MIFVEWLRVRNCLRLVAIVLGVVILGALVVRIAVSGELTYDSFLSKIQNEPGTSAVRSKGPDGADRLVLDNPTDNVHVVVDDYGDHGKHIVVTEPASNKSDDIHMSVGSVSLNETVQGAVKTQDIETNGTIPLIFISGEVAIVTLIVATILGAPLARETDGHLEIALTKPISRERFALGTIAVDVAGILAAMVMAFATLMIVVSFFEVPRIDVSGFNVVEVLAKAVAIPIAWYAMLCAATTSLRRGYAAVLGFAWPAAVTVVAMNAAHLGNSTIASAVHGLFWVLSRIDPLTYIYFAGGDASQPGSPLPPNPVLPDYAVRVEALLVLFVVYTTVAVLQWRRVEAS